MICALVLYVKEFPLTVMIATHVLLILAVTEIVLTGMLKTEQLVTITIFAQLLINVSLVDVLGLLNVLKTLYANLLSVMPLLVNALLYTMMAFHVKLNLDFVMLIPMKEYVLKENVFFLLEIVMTTMSVLTNSVTNPVVVYMLALLLLVPTAVTFAPSTLA